MIVKPIRLMLIALLSLLFAAQMVGFTMSAGAHLPGTRGDTVLDISADSREMQAHAGQVMDHTSCDDKAAAGADHCQADSGCTISHCAAGGILAAEGFQVGLLPPERALFDYTDGFPSAPNFPLYQPPIA